MAGAHWFRFYDEALNDPKVQTLDLMTFKIWVNCLCLASANGKNNGELGTLHHVSFALRETESTVSSAFHALLDRGLIVTENETFHIPKWAKRQYKSDISTDRVRKHRKRYRNVPETPPDTDTDTEKNKEKVNQKERRRKNVQKAESPVVEGLDAETWETWVAYRAQIKKPIKPPSVPAAQKQMAKFADRQREVVEHSIANGYQGLFAPNEKPNGKPKPNGNDMSHSFAGSTADAKPGESMEAYQRRKEAEQRRAQSETGDYQWVNRE